MKKISVYSPLMDVADQKFHVTLMKSDHDTLLGALSVLQNNKFHLNEIDFQPDDVFLDLGCNIGVVSMYVAKRFPFVKVLSFDPSDIALRCLDFSLNLNKITNVRMVHCAIGNEDKPVSFLSGPEEATCAVEESINDDVHRPLVGTRYTVQMIPFTKIFDDPVFGVQKAKYVKMDIEGGEFAALEGLWKRPDIIERIEYLHLEIHKFPKFDWQKLERETIERFGNKVFFDV